MLPQRGLGAFLVPSSPDVPLTPGRWQVDLGQFDVDSSSNANDPLITARPGAVRVFVLLRAVRVVAGAVGLAFHFTGAVDLTAQSAPSSPAFQDMLALVAERDQVIPSQHARRLFEAWRGPKQWREVAVADHDSISSAPEYWVSIRDFLAAGARLPRDQGH